jgi:hypothetical protein
LFAGGIAVRTVDLKSDMPSVLEALQRMQRELEASRSKGAGLLKIIHGYGSTGVGGDIRIAVQKRLREMVDCGEVRDCIFGENWSTTDETTWRLLQKQPQWKKDPHLGRRNLGITIVIL